MRAMKKAIHNSQLMLLFFDCPLPTAHCLLPSAYFLSAEAAQSCANEEML